MLQKYIVVNYICLKTVVYGITRHQLKHMVCE